LRPGWHLGQHHHRGLRRLGGQAGIAGHLTIGRGCKVDGQTGVNSSLEPGSSVKGSPCLPYSLEQRVNVLRKRLPDLFKRVDALEEEIKKIFRQARLKIFSGNSNRPLAEEICRHRHPAGRGHVTSFPDGESFVKINENIRGATSISSSRPARRRIIT
jgi:hypothetical protein